MKARRLLAGGGLVLASVGITGMMLPGVASADPTCYTCSPPTTTSTTDPVTPPTAPPSSPGGQTLPFTSGSGGNVTTSSVSSLPFTGADFEEIAVVGAGALVLGGVLTRRNRRRKTSDD